MTCVQALRRKAQSDIVRNATIPPTAQAALTQHLMGDQSINPCKTSTRLRRSLSAYQQQCTQALMHKVTVTMPQ